MSGSAVKVLQVTNISPSATKEQIQTLFSYIGRIEECRVYPTAATQTQSKFAYVKFDRESSVELGQHLTNVVFIDRALVCIPAPTNKIPDEETAMRAGPSLPGQRQLPPNVTNSIRKDQDGQEMLYTNDPTISSLGLAPYPPLPANTEPSKVEEIRRTVYIGNLEKGCKGDELMQFLNGTIGEVMYLRMAAGNEYLPCDYAYVEFSSQETVLLALQNDGIEFNGRPLKIQHSKVAIVKPMAKTTDQALKEVEDAIEADKFRGDSGLSRAYSPADRGAALIRRRSPSPVRRRRSPSPPPRKRRSPSYEDRRSGSRRRSPSPSHKRKHKKRSRSRERDRSKDRSRRSHSRKKDKKRKRSRSRS
jgi:arginine/serine-rich splicing factor 12